MSMRAGALVGIVLAALVAAGCVGGPGAATPSPTPTDPPVPATLPPLPASDPPSPVPSATIEVSTVYTPDDEEIAALIEAGADEAIPQLKALNKMDPQKLEDLFLPFGEWIEAQRAGVAAYTPSTCTAALPSTNVTEPEEVVTTGASSTAVTVTWRLAIALGSVPSSTRSSIVRVAALGASLVFA